MYDMKKLGILLTFQPNGSTEFINVPDGIDVSFFAEKQETGEYLCRFGLKNITDSPVTGIFKYELGLKAKEPEFFMPAFMYNRNRGNVEPYRDQNGTVGPFPRIGDRDGLMYSKYWWVRSDRLSHPVACVYADGQALAISGGTVVMRAGRDLVTGMTDDRDSMVQYCGFSAELCEEEGKVAYTIGYRNAPHLYNESTSPVKYDIMAQVNETCITLKSGESVSGEFRIYRVSGDDERVINDIIRSIYRICHKPPRKGSSVKEAVSSIASAINEYTYIDELRNYSTKVFLKNGKIELEPLVSISWTGGIETATPILYCAYRLHDEDIRKNALSCINFIVDNSLNPNSSLPFDAYENGEWTVKGWWEPRLSHSAHSSYLIGQFLHYLIIGYKYERDFYGVDHTSWIDFAEKVLTVCINTRNADGEVAHLWSTESEAAVEFDSFSGCWCIAAAAEYTEVTGDDRFLSAAAESLEHYHKEYVCKMECYGTPHDTWKAVDSEGVLSFIKAAASMHRLTGESKYLDMLCDGLNYEFTFKFCYNTANEYQPLRKLGWSTCGGSVTSVCNPHIHPMSNNVTDEIFYCYKQTGDNYYLDRYLDTTAWALQTYSRYDGEYDYGKKGWMSERFCYSQGLLSEQYPDGSPASTWFCFLPWGAANILEGLCSLPWDAEQESGDWHTVTNM